MQGVFLFNLKVQNNMQMKDEPNTKQRKSQQLTLLLVKADFCGTLA